MVGAGAGGPGPGPDPRVPPACAGAYECRSRPLCGSEADAADRRLLLERLLAGRSPSPRARQSHCDVSARERCRCRCQVEADDGANAGVGCGLSAFAGRTGVPFDAWLVDDAGETELERC